MSNQLSGEIHHKMKLDLFQIGNYLGNLLK